MCDNSTSITIQFVQFNSTCHNMDSTSGTNTFLHFLDSFTNDPILSKSATSLQVHAPSWSGAPSLTHTSFIHLCLEYRIFTCAKTCSWRIIKQPVQLYKSSKYTLGLDGKITSLNCSCTKVYSQISLLVAVQKYTVEVHS